MKSNATHAPVSAVVELDWEQWHKHGCMVILEEVVLGFSIRTTFEGVYDDKSHPFRTRLSGTQYKTVYYEFGTPTRESALQRHRQFTEEFKQNCGLK